jgi:adenylate cyclase
MAQLIDATTGYHLFSDRYDRVLKEIFAIQDEITMKILTAIRVKLTEGISARMLSKGASNIEAYLLVLEARELMLRFNRDDNALARRNCEEAIALDPGYPGAYGLLSTLYVMDMVFGVTPKESMEKAIVAAKRAVALDDTRSDAHISLGFVYAWRRQFDEAVAEGERAVELEPGSAGAWFSLGRTLDYACRHKEAIGMLKKAVRMNPFSPTYYFFHLGYAYFNSEEFDKAIAAYQKALQLSPTNMAAHQGLAACYGHLGRMEEARFHAQELLKFNPKFTIESYLEKSPFKERATRERWAEGFRKAGLK